MLPGGPTGGETNDDRRAPDDAFDALTVEQHKPGDQGVLAFFPVRHAGPMGILVPRQIRMTGMTGGVPYYGGRFTPAQAYAAAHPPRPAAPPPTGHAPALSRGGQVAALQHLLDAGVLTQEEFDELRARVEE